MRSCVIDLLMHIMHINICTNSFIISYKSCKSYRCQYSLTRGTEFKADFDFNYSFLTVAWCSTRVGAHDRLLAWAEASVTYAVLQSRPSSSSPSSPFHSTFPTTRITSGFAHSPAAGNVHSTPFCVTQGPVGRVQLMGVRARVWYCRCSRLMSAHTVRIPARGGGGVQGVVPLTVCQQQLLLIVPGGSSVSLALIGIYGTHTSHRESPQCHTDLNPLTSAHVH